MHTGSEPLASTRSGLPAGQFQSELDWFVTLLRREGITSYLEIGARSGDTVWEVAKVLPKGAKILAVDLPNEHWGLEGSDTALRSCIRDLCDRGYDAHLLLGDSHADWLKALVKSYGMFDAGLIDGDHTFDGVMEDWLSYGPQCRIAAFHDIAWSRLLSSVNTKPRIAVPEFWQLTKSQYRHVEMSAEPGNCGIGVLWR